MSRLFDLSHAVEAGMVTYRGLPGPVITDHLSREACRGMRAPCGRSRKPGRRLRKSFRMSAEPILSPIRIIG
jgi:hypothetical protein